MVRATIENSDSVGQIDLEYSEKIEDITLAKGKKTLILKTGSMMPPFQAMNVCTADLVRHWGLDPEQHKSFTRKPEWTNQQIIARRLQSTYPRDALRAGESALIQMRVIVETDGSVSGCALRYTTKAENLDSPACKEMRRAQFEPALDNEGKPMRSFYMTRITYTVN